MDLTNYRGDTLGMRLRMQSQGVPVDLSKWVFEAFIRESPSGPKIAQFQIYQTGDKNGADIENGIIRAVLDAPQAQLLPATCIWDLQATDSTIGGTPRVRTLLRGYIYSTGDVTYTDDPGVPVVPEEEE
jgi:hypothetical protein